MASVALAILPGCTSGGADNWTPPPRPPGPSTSAAPQPAGPQFAEPKLVGDVVAAAKNAVTAINTYDYRQLDQAVAAAKDHTTGKLRTRIMDSFSSAVRAQLKRVKAVQETTVADTGLAALGPRGLRADVLVGGTLRTAKANADPTVRAFDTVIELTRVHHRWLASDQHAPDGTTHPPRGNAALRDAFNAADEHLAALYTIRRKHFDQDYDRLLRYTTGDARDGLAHRRDAIRATMTRDHVDYKGKVSALSVSSVSRNEVHLYAVVDSYPEFNGVKGSVRHRQLDVTLTRAKQTWLISNLATPGG